MNSKTALLVSSLCASLVGCLDSEKQSSSMTESTQSANSQLTVVEMASVSNDKNCNNGKEGSVAYDASQNGFFVCTSGQWVAVDLRGPKGDKGDTGSAGSVGAPGSTGSNGSNGRDGIDGEGVRLSIRDGNKLLGVLVQFDTTSNTRAALIALPTGQYVYYNTATGEQMGTSKTIVFTGPNCSGDAYTEGSYDNWPAFIGRVFTNTTSGGAKVYYQVTGYPTGNEIYRSYRAWSSYGPGSDAGICYNQQPISPYPTLKVTWVTAPQVLTNYAPLQFTF